MRFPRLSFRSLVLVVITLSALMSSALVIPEAQPQRDPSPWYDTQWLKRRPVTINNTLNPSNLLDYQVRVTVNYDSDMKSDFSDLRFTQNETVLPYWIETYTASTSATIWVRTSNLSTSSNTTIYMYYGNPAATGVSNGTATFEFFDDFAGSTLNPDKWTEDAVNDITHTVNNYFKFEDSTKTASDAYWIYDGTDKGSQHHAKWTPLGNFIVDFTSRINDIAGNERGQGFFGLLAPDNTVIGVAGHQDYSPTAVGASRAVVVESTPSSLGSGVNKFSLIYFKWVIATDSTEWTIVNNGTTLKFYDVAGFYLEAPISSAVSKLALVAGAWNAYPYLDYVQESNLRVRRYTSLEPSCTVGLEEDYRMKAKFTWWNPSWPYRSPINMTENSGQNLINYQTKLTVDYVSSKMKTDFSDIRFIDNDQTTALSYWIESLEPSVSAVVWVRVPLIPASGTRTIYMYYGNPSATSAANGKTTFEFFEDFETEYGGPSQWTEKQPLPEGRADPSSAVYDGKIYVFGGYYQDTNNPRNETCEYDPASNSWTRKADMPTARWGPVAVEFNGLIYVFSGTVNVNEVYNPVNNTWQAKGPMPSGFNQGLMATKYGDKIHLFYTGTHYEYDPATDTYTPKAGVPTSRYWAACAVANNKIYLIGGYRPSIFDAVNVNEAYDPATNTWTTKAPMPVGKWGGGRENPIIDGRIYVTHGRDAGHFYVSNYVYDVQTDSWYQKSPGIHARAGNTAAVVNNKLYVIGGVFRVEGQTDIGLAYNEYYDPATDTWTESPWNVSDPSKVRIDESAKYEGAHGLLIDDDVASTEQFAQRPHNLATCAVDFYWNVTDYYGVNGLQPKGMLLLSDSGNPGNGALYYYDEDGSKFFWFRSGEFTYLQGGSWNAWYPVTVVWNGANSRVIINGTEHVVSSAQVNSDRVYFGTQQQTRMHIDLVRIRKYTTPPPTATIGTEEEPASVQSCDSFGDPDDTFYAGETVYLKGSNLLESTNYNVYIVNDVAQWNNGDPIPERIMGTVSTLSSDSSGNIQATLAWGLAAVGNFDVVLDVFENGLYDIAFDALHSFEVVAPPLRDVAVLSMAVSEMNVGSGYSLTVNATVENQGEVTENINLTLFANDTAIANEIVTLGSGESTIVSSAWNTTGFPLGIYVMSAYATPVPGETDIVDNLLNSTNVFMTIPGDVDCNRIVDARDLWELGKAYAAERGTPEWNPDADINNDEVVDNIDVQIISASWGRRW